MQCETRGKKTLYHKNIWGKTLLEEDFLASPWVLQPKALPSHGEPSVRVHGAKRKIAPSSVGRSWVNMERVVVRSVLEPTGGIRNGGPG